MKVRDSQARAQTELGSWASRGTEGPEREIEIEIERERS